MGDFCAVSLKLRSEIKRWCYRKSNILMVFGQIWDNPIFWGFWVAILACQLWDRSIIKWPYRLFFRWKNWKDLLRNILLLKNLDFSYARNILGPNFFMSDILRILIRDNRIFWLFLRILSSDPPRLIEIYYAVEDRLRLIWIYSQDNFSQNF